MHRRDRSNESEGSPNLDEAIPVELAGHLIAQLRELCARHARSSAKRVPWHSVWTDCFRLDERKSPNSIVGARKQDEVRPPPDNPHQYCGRNHRFGKPAREDLTQNADT